MKCKTCGSKLLEGTKKCPYCGAIQTSETKTENSFNWNLSDFPQQKKKHHVDIDWSAGKLFDRESGQVYDQSENSWSEPEEVKGLFSFDQKNEEYQAQLDRQVEMITEAEPPGRQAAERPAGFDFDLPSSMDMGLFSSLINDDAEINLVSSDGEITRLSSTGEILPDEPAPVNSDQEGSEAESLEVQEEILDSESESEYDQDTADAAEADPLVEFAEKKAAEKEKLAEEAQRTQIVYETPEKREAEKKEPDPKDSYTPEDEDRVSRGLKKLMDAEEQFRSDMERAAYITPEESAQAEKVEEKSRKLTFAPTMSFRSIEDEYAAYCDENGIEHSVYAPTVREAKPAPVKKSMGAGLMSSLRRRKSHDDNKEVEIKINEASGTQVTVKTQEISLARTAGDDNKATREVNLDEVVNAPKNLQVSVEVSAGQGNASVEVTRTHDGATLVKTVNNANQDALFADEKANTKEIELEAVEAAAEEVSAESAEASSAADTSAEENAEPAAAAGETDSEDGSSEGLESEAPADAEAAEADTTAEEAESEEKTEESSDTDEPAAEAEEDKTEGSEEASEGDKPAEASEENADHDDMSDLKELTDEPKSEETSFWERSDKATRMTITDIFGPEARRIIDQIDKVYNGDEKEIEEDMKKSLILDINPEDIQITAEQTAALRLSREERKTAEPPVNAASDNNTDAADSLFKELQDVEGEGIAAQGLEKTRAIMKAEKAIEKEAERQKKKKEKLRRKQEKKAKNKNKNIPEEEAAGIPEVAVEAAEVVNEIAKKEPAKIDKAPKEKSDKKKKSAEKETAKSKGLGKPAKVIVVILMLLLIAEFSIIGIKLYAGDSQIAVFIEKVEDNIFSLFNGGDSGSSLPEPAQDVQQADAAGGYTAPPADTAVPEDNADTEVPA